MNIPEEVLDQAARDAYAAYYGEQPDEWEKVWRNEDRVDWVNVARAALSAAAPTLMAMAWDEGAKAMMRAVESENVVSFIAPNNPYRKEAL